MCKYVNSVQLKISDCNLAHFSFIWLEQTGDFFFLSHFYVEFVRESETFMIIFSPRLESLQF